jgi:hypothetical protein
MKFAGSVKISMTQAPEEYIITENLIKVILMQVNRDVEMDEDEHASLAEALRSRPHPAPAYDELQTVNKMLEAEVDRLTGIEAEAARKAREDVLEHIENYLCSCVWSNAPDCPGQTDGECICDGCERFEYPFPEDAREYVKSLRSREEP